MSNYNYENLVHCNLKEYENLVHLWVSGGGGGGGGGGSVVK